MSDTVNVLKIMQATGVAGQVSYTATVQYEGEEPSSVTFVGQKNSYGPVVMVTRPGVQVFVTEPGRFGKFNVEWVRKFFGTPEYTLPSGERV